MTRPEFHSGRSNPARSAATTRPRRAGSVSRIESGCIVHSASDHRWECATSGPPADRPFGPEIVQLAANLLGPLARRMREEREVWAGFARLVGLPAAGRLADGDRSFQQRVSERILKKESIMHQK